MATLADFPITSKWPPEKPDRIQLYSFATPNGVKVSIALEEMRLPYEAHKISFATNEQQSPEFLSLNPNGKIPALIDPLGPHGKPVGLFESGAILLYLAEKSGQLLGDLYTTLPWLMFQMGGVGPMFGQVGFFYKYGGKDYDDKRPRDRYVNETKRLLGVMDGRYQKYQWIAGDDYTIADIAILPWVKGLLEFYEAGELVEIERFPHVLRALTAFRARPAVQRGLLVCA